MSQYSFEKYKNAASEYVDDEGCYWNNAEDWLWCHRLGMCGCGQPDDCLNFITNFLKLKEKESEEYNKCNFKNDEIDNLYDKYKKLNIQLIMENIDRIIEMLNHFLDSKGVLEHGSSVNGAWIDDTDFYKDCLKWQEEEYNK